MPIDSATKEGECSSYGTYGSEQEVALEMQVNIDGDEWMESVESMRCSTAAWDATQNVIVDKLAALEKLVTYVHEDMTWVLSDLGVVHEIVNKLADYVSTLNNTVAVVDGVPKQRSLEVYARGTWKDKAHAKAPERARNNTNCKNERIQLG